MNENPYSLSGQPLFAVQPAVCVLLLENTAYIEKALEDSTGSEEIRQLLL